MTAKKNSPHDMRGVKKAEAKKPPPDTSNLDLDPDAWPKFEKLVKSAAKMGPRPHIKTKK